jgi:NTP pyrophosphatase (non-canonical NTP hydrolase)
MEWLDYQGFVQSTKRYDERFRLIYPVLGLSSEAGEVAGKLKKVLRDQNGEINDDQRMRLIDELSDVLWYVTCCADDLSLSLHDLAVHNVQKLTDRVQRDVIHGDGDNR